MLTPTSAARLTRANRAGWRTLRNGALAVAVVMLPEILTFLKRGDFTKIALIQLAQSLLVVILTATLNFLSRLQSSQSADGFSRVDVPHIYTRRAAENSPVNGKSAPPE